MTNRYPWPRPLSVEQDEAAAMLVDGPRRCVYGPFAVLVESPIVRERARAVGAATPMLDACAPIYDLAAEGGLANRDPAAVYRALSPGPCPEPRNSPCT
jgi:hypothetical protein